MAAGLALAGVMAFSGCTTVSSTAPSGETNRYSVLDTNAVISGINLVVPTAVRLAVSFGLSFCVAMAGVAAGMRWQAFIAVLGTALATHLGAYVKDHPPEQIEFDDGQPTTSTKAKQ